MTIGGTVTPTKGRNLELLITVPPGSYGWRKFKGPPCMGILPELTLSSGKKSNLYI